MKDLRKIDNKKIFVTILSEYASVGDYFLLTKDKKNGHDEEAILATYFLPEVKKSKNTSITVYDDETDFEEINYVANSVHTVARGTYSAGRIYDKFDKKLLVKVKFALKRAAICEVLGEPIEKKPAKKTKKKSK